MAIVSGSPWQFEDGDLVNLLAEFASWLTNPWATERLHITSMQAADRFLRDKKDYERQGAGLPGVRECFLCGYRIPDSAQGYREHWTGDNVLLCWPCFQHQGEVVQRIGSLAYREYWRQEREGEAGNG